MGWKCSQSFYFGFQVTLLTTIATFNQNYFNFLSALTAAIGAGTPNAITITGITPGSVVVTGGAGPAAGSGTKQSNQQFSSLDATLSVSNQIAGMPIGESSVTVVGGTIDFSEVNLALILGICIPVGILRKFMIYFSDCGYCAVHLLQEKKISRHSRRKDQGRQWIHGKGVLRAQ